MVNTTLTQPPSQGSSNFFTKNFDLLAGVLLCTTAILTYWYGSYTFTPIEIHILTLPLLIAGLVLLFFSHQTLKQLAFPLLFLFFLTPPPTEILYGAGSVLSDLSAHASNALISLFGISSAITSQYNSPIITITRPDQTLMNFSVDVACSGVYSLIGFVIFAFFIAYITRHAKLWHKIVIFALGIPLIITLNILRITAIIGIGYLNGEQLALQVFHAVGATVLMFIGTLILLIATDRLIKPPKPILSPPIYEKPTPLKSKLTKVDLTKIVAIAITIILLLTIQAPVFALTQGPAQILTQTPTGLQPNTQTLPLPILPNYNLSYMYRDTNFEKVSGQDASLAYAYIPTNRSQPTVWVAVEIAQSTGPLHRWETCLVNYPLSQGLQPRVTQLDLRDIQTQQNPPIIGRYFAFQDQTQNTNQTVLYWYTTATFQVDNQTEQKHVKISLVTYPTDINQISEHEALLLPIAESINTMWQPIKTWTTMALALSQNGTALVSAVIAILAVVVIIRFYMYRQDRAALRIFYGKLSKQKQQIAEAVKNAKKQGNSTKQGIADELTKLTGVKVNPEALQNDLQEAQNAGLIQRTLINRNDDPAIEYRSNLP